MNNKTFAVVYGAVAPLVGFVAGVGVATLIYLAKK